MRRPRPKEAIVSEIHRPQVSILGVSFDALTLAQAVGRVEELWRTEGHQVVTANPEMVMVARESSERGLALRRAIEGSSLVVADGIGVVLASRLLGTPLPERVPGIELSDRVLACAARQGKRVFLLGGRPGVARHAAERLAQRHPGLDVAGVRHGYFGNDDNALVVQEIARSGAELMLVGLGVPRQELWIAEYMAATGVRVAIGVGGALDVFAGRVPRAPVAFRRLGLEWAYRLAREPRRIVRMSALPRFAAAVLSDRVAALRRGGPPE